MKFSEFKNLSKDSILENVGVSRREGIVHLQDMKNVDFVEFAKEVLEKTKGKLDNVSVSLKVDGAGARVGRDPNGKFFFETSRSGPITQRNSFSIFTKARGGDDIQIQRAQKYDELFDDLYDADFLSAIPSNTKVIIEIMYNPMAVEEKEGLRFVSLPYDKSKLGSLMTISIIDIQYADSGEHHENADEIEKNLLKKSNQKIKIVASKLTTGSLDIHGIIEPIKFMNREMIDILRSRKKVDIELKKEYNAIIDEIKEKMADFILSHPSIFDKTILGDKYEGLVLKIGSKNFKITTKDYDNARISSKSK